MLSEAYVAASMITDAPLLLCDTSWAGKVCEQRETPRRAAVWRIQLCLALGS